MKLSPALSTLSIGCLIAMAPVAGVAASFDCSKNLTPMESLICSDNSLSQLDEKMSKAYSAALARSSDKAALRREQREWIARRDPCGANRDCLEGAYKTRIMDLELAADQGTRAIVIGPKLGVFKLEIRQSVGVGYTISVFDAGGKTLQTISIESSVEPKSLLTVMDVDGDGYKDLLINNGYGAGPFAFTSLYRFNVKSGAFDIEKVFPGDGYPTPTAKRGCVYLEARRSAGNGQYDYDITQWCRVEDTSGEGQWIAGKSCDYRTSCYKQRERYIREWSKTHRE